MKNLFLDTNPLLQKRFKSSIYMIHCEAYLYL